MKCLNLIAHTIITKRNQYKLLIALCLLAIMFSTGNSFAQDDDSNAACC